MKPPAALMANYENNQLIILFESEPKETLALKGKVDFGIYDPTFYTAIDYTEDENMAVKDLPASCTRAVIRPDPDEAISQNQASLTDEFFTDPTGTDLSKIFATKLELTCTGLRAEESGCEKDNDPDRLRAARADLCAHPFPRPCACAELARHRHQRGDRSLDRPVRRLADLDQCAAAGLSTAR